MSYNGDIAKELEVAAPRQKARMPAMDSLDDYALLQQVAHHEDRNAFT